MTLYLRGLVTTDQNVSSGDVIVSASATVDASIYLSSLSDVHVAGYVYKIEETDDTLFMGSDDITVTGSGEVEFLILQGGDNTIYNDGIIGGRNGFIRILAGSAISSNYFENYIVNSGTIASRDWTGQSTIEILSPNAETSIINTGTISSLHSSAILLGAAGGIIANSGSIFGPIRLGDGGSEVDNTGGSIDCDGSGISGGAAGDTLRNGGTIVGYIDLHDGANILDNSTGSISGDVYLGTGGDTILNGGTITGDIDAGEGGDAFANSGTVTGAVLMKGGSDTADNTGSIFGDVDLGAGDDKFNNSGTLKGNFLANEGFERLFNTGSIVGDVDFGNGGSRFINSGTVTGDVRLGNAGDTGFLNSSHGALYGTITGGGAGNTIYTSNVGNYVAGGAGTDIVHGGTGDDEVYGFGGQDSLYGGGGADSLDGGTGPDFMAGGSGDDAYFVESGGDIVNELTQSGSGYDYVRVIGAINFDLADKVHVKGDVEDLYMDGVTQNEAINGSGNGLDNVITGNDGANTLDGRGGDDALTGYGGNDVLVGGDGDDALYGLTGNDTLRGGAGADLLDGGAGAADMADYLTGATTGVTVALNGSLAATGDALGDTFVGIERLRGTDFADTLRGNNQANVIFGQGGADSLDGGVGDDRLTGGLGIDTLTGGTGSDRFVYMSLAEVGDTITDFIGYNDVPSINEAIEIKGSAFGGGLVAGELAFTSFQTRADNLAQDADDRFIYRTTDTTLWFDVDGNGASAAVMVADLQAGATVDSSDIIIV